MCLLSPLLVDGRPMAAANALLHSLLPPPGFSVFHKVWSDDQCIKVGQQEDAAPADCARTCLVLPACNAFSWTQTSRACTLRACRPIQPPLLDVEGTVGYATCMRKIERKSKSSAPLHRCSPPSERVGDTVFEFVGFGFAFSFISYLLSTVY